MILKRKNERKKKKRLQGLSLWHIYIFFTVCSRKRGIYKLILNGNERLAYTWHIPTTQYEGNYVQCDLAAIYIVTYQGLKQSDPFYFRVITMHLNAQ